MNINNEISDGIEEYKECLVNNFDKKTATLMLDAFTEGIDFCKHLYKEPIQNLKINVEKYQALYAELKKRVQELEEIQK